MLDIIVNNGYNILVNKKNKKGGMCMKNIVFVKMTVTEGRRNYISIVKYRVQKVTDKRVYYYTVLNEDTTEDDVKYVEKDRFGDCEVICVGGIGSIISSVWCYEEDLDISKELVAKELEGYLNNLISNISKCFDDVKVKSMIKI